MSNAKVAADFIDQHPVIKECIAKGLVNFSELARQIIKQEKIGNENFDALVVAIRRYAEKTKPRKENEKAIVELLQKSNLEMKNKICSVVADETTAFSQLSKLIVEINEKQEPIHLIQGSRTFTIITSQNFLEKIERLFAGKIISKKKNLLQIVIRSSPTIESTPGVVAFIYGLFAEKGINIVETMSSWTETLILIEEKDIEKSMKALDFKKEEKQK